MAEKFIRCDCGAAEHQAILSYFPDEEHDFQVLYLQIHLTSWGNIFPRLWHAIRYVFGYHCCYGHWDEIIINKEKAAEIRDFIARFLEASAQQVTAPENGA